MGAGGSRRAARRLRMERGGAGGAWREQVHTSRGPIRGPNDYPHRGSDGPSPRDGSREPGSHHDGLGCLQPGRRQGGPIGSPGRWTGADEVSESPYVRLGSFIGPDPNRAPHCRPWGRTNARRPPRVPLGLGKCGEEGSSGDRPNSRSGRGPPRGTQRVTSIQVSLHHKLPPVHGAVWEWLCWEPPPGGTRGRRGQDLSGRAQPVSPRPQGLTGRRETTGQVSARRHHTSRPSGPRGAHDLACAGATDSPRRTPAPALGPVRGSRDRRGCSDQA